MKNFEDTKHLSKVEPDYNLEREISFEESGFNIAVGFIENASYSSKKVVTHGYIDLKITYETSTLEERSISTDLASEDNYTIIKDSKELK